MKAEPRVAATPAKTAIPARDKIIKSTFLPTNWAYSSLSSDAPIVSVVGIVGSIQMLLCSYVYYSSKYQLFKADILRFPIRLYQFRSIYNIFNNIIACGVVSD